MRLPVPAILMTVLAGCGFGGLGVVDDPEPDAGMEADAGFFDPGGPPPAPVEGCLRDTNVAVVEGEEGARVFEGAAVIDDGTWAGGTSQGGRSLHVTFVSPQSAGTPTWRFEFSSNGLGRVLEERTYNDAALIPEPSGVPGLAVSAGGRSCAKVVGRFRVHQLRLEGARVEAFVATFEQRCGNENAYVRGCVRFSDPD